MSCFLNILDDFAKLNLSLPMPSQQEGSDSERENATKMLPQATTDEASEALPIPGNNQSTPDQQITSEPSSSSGKCTFIRQQRYLSLVRNQFTCTNFQLGNIALCGNTLCKNVL